MTSLAPATLTDHQRRVAADAIGQESRARLHVVVSLSGAHAYGFPSPDSDLDIKAVHLDPTQSFLGFPHTASSAERLEVREGVEIDYSSNELGGVLLGALKGNGNFIERFLSAFTLFEGSHFAEARALVQGSLSRRVHRHYLGFATQQKNEWEKTGRRSAKKLLYVLRTTLTGTHLLRTGEVVTDVTRLLERNGFGDAVELVEQKRRGERAELEPELAARWADRLPRAFSALDDALRESPLPESPPNERELEGWLIATRLTLLR